MFLAKKNHRKFLVIVELQINTKQVLPKVDYFLTIRASFLKTFFLTFLGKSHSNLSRFKFVHDKNAFVLG